MACSGNREGHGPGFAAPGAWLDVSSPAHVAHVLRKLPGGIARPPIVAHQQPLASARRKTAADPCGALPHDLRKITRVRGKAWALELLVALSILPHLTSLS